MLPEAGDSGQPALPDIRAGIATIVRGLDHSIRLDAEIVVGAQISDPDASGVSLFLAAPTGRITAVASRTATMASHVPSSVMAGEVSGAQIYLADPYGMHVVVDAAAGGQVVEGGLVMDVPPGAFRKGGQVVVEPIEVGVTFIDASNHLALPSSPHALRNDEIIEPIELYGAWWIEPVPFRGTWNVNPDDPPVVTFTLPPDSPGIGAGEVDLFFYDHKKTYWEKTRTANVEGDVVVAPSPLFGYWAVGRVVTGVGGCIRGEVVDARGAGLPGVELLVTEPSRFGPRRATTDETGMYCVDVTPGVAPTVRLFGVSEDLTLRYILETSLSAAGSGSCTAICPAAIPLQLTPVRRGS